MNKRDAIVPAIIALLLIAVFFWLSPGLGLIVTFVPSMGAAYVCYMLTSYRATPDPARVLPVYIMALAAQSLHFGEEFVTGFYTRWPREIFHAPPFGLGTWVLINLIAQAAFTMGALAIYRRVKVGMIIVWFFAIMGVAVNGVQHPIYCLMVGGYFPGLFTSLLHLALAPFLLSGLWRGSRDAAKVHA